MRSVIGRSFLVLAMARPRRLRGAIGCLALMLLVPGASAAGDLPHSIAETGAFGGDFVDNVRPVRSRKGDDSYAAQWRRYQASNTCWAWSDGCNTCSKGWLSKDVMCTARSCPGTESKFKCLLGF